MKALITGVTGQDGHYLSELLIRKGYDVYGLVRRSAQDKDIPEGITPVEGEITDSSGTAQIIKSILPDQVYHLAAMSHVGESFKIPSATFQINAVGTLNLLEAIRTNGRSDTRVYNAATSELFGVSEAPQSETTRFHPRSPYGVAKLAAFYTVVNYREAYGMHASNGILFNHESPKRGSDFVTQKIANAAARIYLGLQEYVELGELNAMRDWGHAKDYVYGMWQMLRQDEPGDYVLATGESHTVRDFCAAAFSVVGLDYEKYVRFNPKYARPAEVWTLRGDPSKAMRVLKWKPVYTFERLVVEMVHAALQRNK